MRWRDKYGERFPACAAPEAIRASLEQAYAKNRAAQQEIRWLFDLLAKRCREVQVGEWPPMDQADTEVLPEATPSG